MFKTLSVDTDPKLAKDFSRSPETRIHLGDWNDWSQIRTTTQKAFKNYGTI